MANELSIFDNPGFVVPDYVNEFVDDVGTNIVDRPTVPSLGVTGKVWSISKDGERTKLTKRDAEGDEVPVSILRGVIVDYAKRRGRTYYERGYDPDNVSQPQCWSDDGVKPHASIQQPQNSACEGCPMNVVGSRTTDNGKETRACSAHRMLAVLPANAIGTDFPALRLKLAVTSDYDKSGAAELAAKNWYAFQQYTDMLQSKGVKHTGAIVTKMKFDPDAEFPKVIFSPDRFLSREEIAQIAPVAKSEAVAALISGSWTPAGVDGVASGTSVPATKAAEPEDTAAVMQRKLDEDKARKAAEKQAKAEAKARAEAEAKAKADAEAKAKAAAADDDDEGDIILPGASGPKAAAAEAAKPAAAAGGLPADVASILGDWDE